jgi:hypothetical protein
MRFGTRGVVNAVVRASGIEVAASACECGSLALRRRVDMDGVFAGRQALEVQRDLYAASSWSVRNFRSFVAVRTPARLPASIG